MEVLWQLAHEPEEPCTGCRLQAASPTRWPLSSPPQLAPAAHQSVALQVQLTHTPSTGTEAGRVDLEWQGGHQADLVADACVAVIMQVRAALRAEKCSLLRGLILHHCFSAWLRSGQCSVLLEA